MKIETNDKFKKITPDEGMVLTSFKEGDDIINYTSARLMYCPLNLELNDLREITEEEDSKYMDEQFKAVEAMNKLK